MSENIEFVTISQEKWESIPPPVPPKAPDKYQRLIEVLAAGTPIELTAESDNDLKGKRIAIGRRARAAGFIAEFRHLDNSLYVKRSDKPLEEKPASTPAGAPESAKKRGRKKKTDAMPTPEDEAETHP